MFHILTFKNGLLSLFTLVKLIEMVSPPSPFNSTNITLHVAQINPDEINVFFSINIECRLQCVHIQVVYSAIANNIIVGSR